MVKKCPSKCIQCGSKNISVKFCEGAPKMNGRVGSLITYTSGGGFVCTTPKKHFHYHCNKCGYNEHN